MATLKCKEFLCLLYSGLLFFSGVILIGLSVVLAYKLFYHFKFVPAVTIGPFIVIFLLGFSHILVTWLAVKGPSKEHDFHIILFVGVTVALFLVEIGVGIWSMIIMGEVSPEIEYSISGFIRKDFDEQEMKKWNLLQDKMQCCGKNNFSDYLQNNLPVPRACYGEVHNSSVHPVGCKEPFTSYVKSLLLEIGICAFLSGLYQVLGVMAFISFYKTLKEERKRRREVMRQVSTISGRSNAHRRAPSIPGTVENT